MFRLTKEEFDSIKLQVGSMNEPGMSSQFVMTYSNKRPSAALPYAFTGQGVAMLSGVINSDKAISMNIAIMRAFVDIKKAMLQKMI